MTTQDQITHVNKTCLDCEHCYIETASCGYSEYTPGYEGDFYCGKSHWKYDAYNDGQSEMRTKLYMALTCADFEPVKDQKR